MSTDNNPSGDPVPSPAPTAENANPPVSDRRAFLRKAGGISLVSFMAGGLTGCFRIENVDLLGGALNLSNAIHAAAGRTFRVKIVLQAKVQINRRKHDSAATVDEDYLIARVFDAIDESWRKDHDNDPNGDGHKLTWDSKPDICITAGSNDERRAVTGLFIGWFGITEKIPGFFGPKGERIAKPGFGRKLRDRLSLDHAWREDENTSQAWIYDSMFSNTYFGDDYGDDKDGDPIPTC